MQAHDPHHSHHWDQAADGPAAGQRSYSVPVRRQAVCETDQYMSDLPEVGRLLPMHYAVVCASMLSSVALALQTNRSGWPAGSQTLG